MTQMKIYKFTWVAVLLLYMLVLSVANSSAQNNNERDIAYIFASDDTQQYILPVSSDGTVLEPVFTSPLISKGTAEEVLPVEEVEAVQAFLLETQGYLLDQGFTEEELFVTLTRPLTVSVRDFQLSSDGKILAIILEKEHCIASLNYCYGLSQILVVSTANITAGPRVLYEVPYHAVDSINVPPNCVITLSSYVKISQIKWLPNNGGIVYSNIGDRGCFNNTGQSSPIIALSLADFHQEPILLGYGTSWNIVSDNEIVATSRNTFLDESKLSVIQFDIATGNVDSSDYVLDADTSIYNPHKFGINDYVAIAFDLFSNLSGIIIFDSDGESRFVSFPEAWPTPFEQVEYTQDGRIIVKDNEKKLHELRITDNDTLELSLIWDKPVETFFVSSQNRIWLEESTSNYTVIDASGEILFEFKISDLIAENLEYYSLRS